MVVVFSIGVLSFEVQGADQTPRRRQALPAATRPSVRERGAGVRFRTGRRAAPEKVRPTARKMWFVFEAEYVTENGRANWSRPVRQTMAWHGPFDTEAEAAAVARARMWAKIDIYAHEARVVEVAARGEPARISPP
jgi:hypothetical protein